MSAFTATGARNNLSSKSWELSLYELHRKPQAAITDNTEIAVPVKDLHTELMCPICLDLLRKTMTTKECLHRFCHECITTALRAGNKECPTCRKKLISRRSLRPDPNFDKMMAKIYPNREDYEQQQDQMLISITKHHSQSSFQACIEEGLKVQATTRHSKAPASTSSVNEPSERWSGDQSSDDESTSAKKSRVCSASDDSMDGSVADTQEEETVEIILTPRQGILTNNETRYLKTTCNASIQHIKKFLNLRTTKSSDEAEMETEDPEVTYIITMIYEGNHITLPNNMTLETVLDSYCTDENPLEMFYAPA